MDELLDAIEDDDLLLIERYLSLDNINECLVYAIGMENIRVVDYLRRHTNNIKQYNEWILEFCLLYNKAQVVEYMYTYVQ